MSDYRSRDMQLSHETMQRAGEKEHQKFKKWQDCTACKRMLKRFGHTVDGKKV